MSAVEPEPPGGRVRLGTVQETLLIPLYGRAVESRKPEAVLRDPVAERVVAAIEYDFARFDGGPSLTGTVLRTNLFDHWVRAFLAEHPDGTVVEIGTGLNTRYERVDNGRARWFELDLPDVIELRRTFFADEPRRRMLAASVLDEGWTAAPAAGSGPYFLAAEAVLGFLPEEDVRRAVDLLAERFPGALLALDTTGPGMVDTQEDHDALGKVEARLRWSCPDPRQLEQWRPDLRLLASHTFTELPGDVHDGLPAEDREMIASMREQRLPQVEDYRLNLLRLG
ncbi:class I SAM-dependent methyltransferase [Streptomyces boncukensis]|uniref:Class I SAM-dependent methyltransferase n=1 Tax=Streptomyces boncukensis TaxID=2711219 RepID=A0A6G4WQS2_9ACTN|nr:class I SAM-dependent methyltransferase [Streptomyces boncukensis]NGO67448.1 class I SAM-dependent methyltransferase [Streptomyces boncukensis]